MRALSIVFVRQVIASTLALAWFNADTLAILGSLGESYYVWITANSSSAQARKVEAWQWRRLETRLLQGVLRCQRGWQVPFRNAFRSLC